MNFVVKCTNCHKVQKSGIVTCTQCLKGLEIDIRGQIKIHDEEKKIFLKYRCFYPDIEQKILTKYPNSQTPIIELHKRNVFAKLEYCSFSSSSKDREAFIEIIMAIKLGYKGIAVASTGNMGAALASLCSVFKFPCYVFIPSDTSDVKVKQIEQFGARIKNQSHWAYGFAYALLFL